METRNIYDSNGSLIGTLTLPEGTSEEEWAAKIADYTYTIPAHSPEEIAYTKLEEAKAFGKKIMDDFTAENILLGITQLGLTNHVRKTLREVKDALHTGSIYDAVTEIALINPVDLDETILSEERILRFRNEIEKWLEVPCAETWNQQETWLDD